MLELVLDDGERIPVTEPVTLGRADDNRVRFENPSVSRHHARVVPVDDGACLEDVGSTYGTYLDGQLVTSPQWLRHGAQIRLGDAVLGVVRPRDEWEAGETVVVVPVVAPDPGAAGADSAGTAVDGDSGGEPTGQHPRVRAGWALKRLEAGEGRRRYVLRDLESGRFLRMSAEEAALFSLLDGRTTLPELLVEAERRFGDAGPAVLARLLADLGARGLLVGVEAEALPLRGRLARLVGPRELATTRADALFDRLYRAGGFVLVATPALVVLGLVATAGLGAFVAIIAAGDLAPFVVRDDLGIGVVVFVAGRFLVVALHEAAHGLAVKSMGRHVPRAGLKAILVFPYAFVDTSEAWFEPRGRRMAISAAGPASDLALGGAFSLVALGAGDSVTGQVAMQLALAGYLGALFNLNPMLDRDGYHLLVDALRQPNLRMRSRERVTTLLAGRPRREAEGGPLLLYGVASIGWSVVGLALVVFFTVRYADRLEALASPAVAWSLLGLLYAIVAVPVAVSVGRPLFERRRSPPLPHA
jgi:putative peptide zinc metalloprotease protein